APAGHAAPARGVRALGGDAALPPVDRGAPLPVPARAHGPERAGDESPRGGAPRAREGDRGRLVADPALGGHALARPDRGDEGTRGVEPHPPREGGRRDGGRRAGLRRTAALDLAEALTN